MVASCTNSDEVRGSNLGEGKSFMNSYQQDDAVFRPVLIIRNFKRDTSRKNGRAARDQVAAGQEGEMERKYRQMFGSMNMGFLVLFEW